MPGSSPLAVAVVAAQLCARVPGGTGRYTRSLLDGLSSTTSPLDGVIAVLPRGCPEGRVLTVPTATLPLPALVLARLWEHGLPPRPPSADVVHAPTLLVPPRRRGEGLVVTIHDVVPWTHPDTLTPRGVRFHRRMGHRAAREADVIVTPTAAVAHQVHEHLQPRCPVRTVALGVTQRSRPDDVAGRRARLGIDRPYVLFVGTAEPRKGLDLLVTAMTRPALAGLDLVVVGPPGWGDVDVVSMANAAGIGSRLVVTGSLADTDLDACYVGARVVAVPSRAEGFGLPVVEAMAHGVPVVTSRDPALTEVGAGAALVASEDPDEIAAACARAAADGPERDLLVEHGRQRAAEFTWERTAKAMWDVYREASER